MMSRGEKHDQVRAAVVAVALLAVITTAPAFADGKDNNLEEVSSPLVSKVAISRVVATIMEGGWWHDRSAAHLVVEDVILRSVGVSKKNKGRKGVILMVRAEVGSRAYIQQVDKITIELYDSKGTLLAAKTWHDTPVGRDLGPSSLSGTKYLILEHPLSQGELAALFADDAQPAVHVTITEED